jgi:hypothetical protein
MRRILSVALALAFVASLAIVATQSLAADRAHNSKKVTQPAGPPEVVQSWTIFDDGDTTADMLVYPPGAATAGWQDHYLLVEGGVVTASTYPFTIEQLQYYYENIYGSWATFGLWTPANLNTYYSGGNPGGNVGWNTVVLSAPLQIAGPGFPGWWMGAENSYTVGNPAPCSTCRQVGVDAGTDIVQGRGFYSDIDLLGFSAINPQPMAADQVPIIRAGITALNNTVPVELLEINVE